MRIVIDIPDDFIDHWNKDRFKDSLCRMKADAGTCELCSGNYEAELCDMLITAFKEAKEVPPHGRLIDADALIEDLERQCKEVFRIDAVSPDDYWITRNEAYNEALWKSWVESFGEYLKTRPTIIEAEE